MDKKLVAITVIFLMLLPALFPTSISEDIEFPIELEGWSFNKEIVIPINTSHEQAKFQPIDIQMNFNNSCWAKDQNEHSIRVYYQNTDEFIELESQIYDLNFSSGNNIASCGLVFLIPEFATGDEKYLVFYDDEEKTNPGYEDRVQIKDEYSIYEPITGLSYESWHYEIKQDDSIIYGISKKGMAVDYELVQQVAVMKPGATNMLPKNGEYAVDLNFKYWYCTDNKWSGIYCDEYVKSDILIDGNLMVKCAIVSQSEDGSLKTTVYYKYYYTPHEDKRIYTHSLGEVIKYPLPIDEKIDIGFASLRFSKTVTSIDDINVDGIPPYLHIYDENDEIIPDQFDTNPEGNKWERIIGPKDDIDLGKYPWFSGDYGETGKAFSFIFETNEIIEPEYNIRDGISIRLFEKKALNLPSVDISFADVYLIGNSYETGEAHDNELPEGFKFEFNAEIFTTQKGGYKTVEKEAEMYQALVSFQPKNNEDINESEEDQEKFTVSARVFLPPSISLEKLGSLLFLKDAHICAEIFEEDDLISKQNKRVGRISITEDLKIDWKNISIFNKVRFEHLKPGKYIIKLFLENSVFDNRRQFIGYEIVNVQKNIDTNIICKPEGKLEVSIKDQNGNGVKDSEVRLIKEGLILISNTSDDNGKVLVGAPSGFGESYQLKILYDGFLVSNEAINLGSFSRVIPIKKNVKLNLSDFTVEIKNQVGETPDVDIRLYLTSDEMNETFEINPDDEDAGVYTFLNLYPADYTLNIEYDRFNVKEEVKIPDNKNFKITLQDFTINVIDDWDLTFGADINVKIESKDLDENIELKGKYLEEEGYTFSNVYPGDYKLKIIFKSYELKQNITVSSTGNNSLEIVFPIKLNVTTKIFDSHGNNLKDSKTIFSRDGVNITGFTDGKGTLKLSLPPGHYEIEVYSSNDLVSKRKVDILNDKQYMIVTNHEPVGFFIVLGLIIISLIGVSIYCVKKKQKMLFFEFLVVLIVLMAIILPWWTLSGSSTEHSVETSTTLYLTTGKLVTFTSSNTTFAGEIVTLGETFDTEMYFLLIAISIGVGLIILNIILKKLHKRKLSSLTFTLGSISLIVSTVAFYHGMLMLSEILAATCTKNGGIEVAVPGETTYVNVSCSFGPNISFYLILLSSVIVICILIFKIIRFFKNRRLN